MHTPLSTAVRDCPYTYRRRTKFITRYKEGEGSAPVLQVAIRKGTCALHMGFKRPFWVKNGFVDALQSAIMVPRHALHTRGEGSAKPIVMCYIFCAPSIKVSQIINYVFLIRFADVSAANSWHSQLDNSNGDYVLSFCRLSHESCIPTV